MASPRVVKCIKNWRKCETCYAIMEQNNFEMHERNNCQQVDSNYNWTYSYIMDETIYSFVKAISHRPTNKYDEENQVLVSYKAAILCDISIGDPVVITSSNSKSIVKIVRPLVDDTLSYVYLNEESLMEMDCSKTNVKIRKLHEQPSAAETIEINFLNIDFFSENQISDIIATMSTYFDSRIICDDQMLVFNHLGNVAKFEVHSVISKFETRSDIDDLERNLKNINLNRDFQKYYRLSSSTKYLVKNNSFLNTNTIQASSKLKLNSYSNIIHKLNFLLGSIFKKGSCVIVYGVAGTGKTYISKALIQNMNLPVIEVKICDIISKIFGESERNIQSLFNEAIQKAPSIIFIDEIDLLVSNQTTEQGIRLLNTILSILEEIKKHKIIVFGITRNIDDIDTNFRKKLDDEIKIPVHGVEDRVKILNAILSCYEHNVSDETVLELSTNAHGYVSGDIKRACVLSATRVFGGVGSGGPDCTIISKDDLTWGFARVKPSATKEMIIEIPHVMWDDIGGQHDLKVNLKKVTEWPWLYKETFDKFKLKPPHGILLYGPPGCSKTMIAKAVATESKLNFISIKGGELFRKLVGESEKAVKELFSVAQTASPTIIFIDEIDSIGEERDADSKGGSNVQGRVLGQLLYEMDGVAPLKDVFVIAATNRPDRIDSALLRPGRLDSKLYVPLPNRDTRRSIFNIKLTANKKIDVSKTPIDESVKINNLVERTEGYSGAEVVAVCHEAAMKACQEANTSIFTSRSTLEKLAVTREHFEYALTTVKARTPKFLLDIYEKFQMSK